MAWNAIERFSTQGIQFLITIIIARILTPTDYGLVAMLSIFLSLAQTFVDSGFYNALIQKKNRTEADYSTMFWFNLAVAAFFYLLLFVSAPLIARFYNQPALVALVRVLGLGLITNSFGTVQMARFTIMLNFKKLAIASLISTSLSGILGIMMAMQGCGVWTLVFQQLLSSMIWVISLCRLSSWFPRRCFSKESLLSFYSYGSKLLFAGLLQTLYLNMYSLVIGKFFNASTLGYYNRASSLGLFPASNFRNVVHSVYFPILCRYQENPTKFSQLFCVYLRLSSFILFPLMIGIAALASPFVSLILTDKWLVMVPMMQVICLAMMWYSVMQANSSVLDAKGRTDWHLRSEIPKKLAALLILIVMLPQGIMYVCWGTALYSLVDLCIGIAYSRRVTGIGYKKQFHILFPTLMLSLVMGVLVFWLTSFIDSDVWSLLVGAVVGVLFFVGTAFLLRMSEAKMLVSFLKERRIVLSDC